ncbi:hypothetical protein CRYUN_Cryun03dG0033700 [Craigia yunnanensis]
MGLLFRWRCHPSWLSCCPRQLRHPASLFVAKHGPLYYKQLLGQNKHCILEPSTFEKCNLLSKQLFYTRLASIPGRYKAFLKEIDYVKHM